MALRGLLALAALGALVIVLGSISSGTYQSAVTAEPGTNSLGFQVRTQGVDPQRGTMSLVLVPRANGSFGQDLPNGAFFTTPVVFNLDVASGESVVEIPASSVAGGIPGQVVLDGNEFNYPFDQYAATLFASASSAGRSSTGEAPEFIINDSSSIVPGFDILATPLSFLNGKSDPQSLEADREAGFGYITWTIERSNATKVIAILIGILMIMGAVVSILITWAILRGRRPPSINAMVWLAAFLFALFQVRHQLPGDPVSGIGFDRVVFFPVVLILVLLIVVNLVSWSTRDDWDMENPVYAVRGRIAGDRSREAEGR